MNDTSPGHIVLVYPETFDPAPFDEFARAVRRPGLDLRLHPSEPRGPMAGIEWYLPTAIVLFLTQGFFNGFLGEMGKDFYASFRKGMTSLWKAFLSRDRQLILEIVATPGKIDPNKPYSHTFAIYAPTEDGSRIKFLFRDDCEREVFDSHVEAILSALEDYYSGSPHSLLRKYILMSHRREHTYLVRYNEQDQKLDMFNPLLERMLGN